MPPDGLYGDGEPAEPNSPVAPVGFPASPTPPMVDRSDPREPDTLTNVPVHRPGAYGVAERSYPTPYDPYQAQLPPPVSDAPPAWADEILDAGPFTTAAGEGEPPIWRRYQELVESQVDSELRAGVLRAGWLALRGRIGGEA